MMRNLHRLTKSIAHPVGKNAIAEAHTSDMVSPHTTKSTVITDTNPRNRRPLRILNMSWKSVPNLLLPIETI